MFNKLDYINRSMRENLLDGLINNVIPLEYSSQLELNRIIIQKSMLIAEEAKEMRVKIEGLRLASQTQQAQERLLVESVQIGKTIQQQVRQVLPVPPTPPVEEHKEEEVSPSPSSVSITEDNQQQDSNGKESDI